MNTSVFPAASEGLSPASLDRLRRSLRGRVLTPSDEGYETARTIWNATIDRRPAVIAGCTDATDVAHAVRFAREHGLMVAVKGGGHNVAGKATCEGGLMIDLAPMRTVHIDPVQRTARVAGGCLLGDLDGAAQQYGLATPAGIVSTTGIAGLTLGGGFGWISRKYGLTIDSLLSAEVVTATGDRLVVNERENPDLFWGLRGGGGNFGIVTEFTFRLHPVGAEVYCGLIVRPFAEAEDYLHFHRDYVRTLPDEMTVWSVIRRAPPLPFLPREVYGQIVQTVPFVFLGDAAHGEQLIAPLRRFGHPHGAAIGMKPFATWQTTFDALTAAGLGNYWKSHFLSELSDQAIATMLHFAGRLPSARSEIFTPHFEGAIARVPAGQTAYGHRGAPFLMNIHGRWEDPAEQERTIAWAREMWEGIKPYSTGGVYVNFLGDEGEARVRDAYDSETWRRLVALKDKYDPENFFRLNQNIPPTKPRRQG